MKKVKLLFITVACAGLVVIAVIFAAGCIVINNSIKSACQKAQAKYEGACTTALSSYLDDDTNDYRSRNTAIWALGQIGEAEALTVLNKYYTGSIPEKEPLDKSISQYELKKAINLASGGLNLSKLLRF